jgi:hypothetical protein
MGIYTNRVVYLTGPAPSVLEQQLYPGKDDLVVRLNKMVPLSDELKAATSDRCDVWYPANVLLSKDPFLCLLPEVKKIRISTKAAELVPASAKHKVSIMNPFTDLGKYVKGTPNRGIKAIADIIVERPEKLFISGFSFYTGEPYYRGYLPEQQMEAIASKKGNIGGHIQQEQLLYMKRVVAKLPFVVLDDFLKHLLNQL